MEAFFLSKRGRVPSDLWETYRAMSTDVGRLGEFAFMKLSACMGLEERKLLAYTLTAREIFNDREFSEFIDGFAVPFLTKLGRAKWGRDVVTDLGFALAFRSAGKRKLGESGKELLEYVPTE